MAWPADAKGKLCFVERLSGAQKEEILRIFHDIGLGFSFSVTKTGGKEKDLAVTDTYFNYDRKAMTDALAKADRTAGMEEGSYIAFLDLDDEEWFFEKRDGTFAEITGRHPAVSHEIG